MTQPSRDVTPKRKFSTTEKIVNIIEDLHFIKSPNVIQTKKEIPTMDPVPRSISTNMVRMRSEQKIVKKTHV